MVNRAIIITAAGGRRNGCVSLRPGLVQALEFEPTFGELLLELDGGI